MRTIDQNRLHEIASGFVTVEPPPESESEAWNHVVRIGEVKVNEFFDESKANTFRGLLVVEIMKLLTGVLEQQGVGT